jgi:hypothetical protein
MCVLVVVCMYAYMRVCRIGAQMHVYTSGISGMQESLLDHVFTQQSLHISYKTCVLCAQDCGDNVLEMNQLSV